jgi:AraC-like DNA-binding protein
MQSMKKNANRKRLIPADQAGSYIDTDTVLQRNRILEGCGLDSFLIRFPRLRMHAHFYYKFIEGGECTIGNHGHWHWEIARVCSGVAEYSIPDSNYFFRPTDAHYLIIPPKITHGWSMKASPLLTHSWQVQIEAEDNEGQQTLKALQEAIVASGFIFKASPSQIQAESLLWQMSGDAGLSQMFGSILSGFARIVLGDLFARINPWPEGMLESKNGQQAALNNLAERMKVFLDENLAHPVTLSDMESHFHYSGRHLNRIFQEILHCSIGHYLRDQRISLAKRWLATTERSVKDIALSLGYNSSSQFCRYFLEREDQTPSDYRQTAEAVSQEQTRRSVRSPDG